jgi:hypothetical protein
MPLPGFTAKRALQEKSDIYTGVAVPAGSEGIVPQFWRCWGTYCCDEYGYCVHRGHVLM